MFVSFEQSRPDAEFAFGRRAVARRSRTSCLPCHPLGFPVASSLFLLNINSRDLVSQPSAELTVTTRSAIAAVSEEKL